MSKHDGYGPRDDGDPYEGWGTAPGVATRSSRFTFFWLAVDRSEGRDFVINVEGTP